MASRLRQLLPVIPALLVSCASTAAQDHGGSAIVGEQTVPLTTVVFSGHRYVVRADIGLRSPVPLMVHGNARVYLALTHDVAEKLTGHPVKKQEDYGYSSRGKGAIDVPVMRLGGKGFGSLSAVPVFDFTEEGDTTVQGMLGTRFLTAAGAAVDFSRNVLVLGVPTSEGQNTGLVAQGYRWVRMDVSADYRVTIDAYFPSIGRTLAITPSTVSNALTLHQPPFAGRVPMRRAPSPDRSPSHTSPEEFVCDRVSFEVAGVRCESAAMLEDLADYAAVPEGGLESFGMLGYDWMAEHRAILDYANRILYFRP